MLYINVSRLWIYRRTKNAYKIIRNFYNSYWMRGVGFSCEFLRDEIITINSYSFYSLCFSCCIYLFVHKFLKIPSLKVYHIFVSVSVRHHLHTLPLAQNWSQCARISNIRSLRRKRRAHTYFPIRGNVCLLCLESLTHNIKRAKLDQFHRRLFTYSIQSL